MPQIHAKCRETNTSYNYENEVELGSFLTQYEFEHTVWKYSECSNKQSATSTAH